MLGIVALAVSGVSLLLDIVGLAIPYWLYSKVPLTDTSNKIGLWKGCLPDCADITNADSSLKATRAMVILGLLLLAAAIAFGVISMFVMAETRVLMALASLSCVKHVDPMPEPKLSKVAGALAGAAGLFIIIGCIIFATKFKEEQSVYMVNLDLYAGFGLCIVAGIGALVAAVLFFVDKQG